MIEKLKQGLLESEQRAGAEKSHSAQLEAQLLRAQTQLTSTTAKLGQVELDYHTLQQTAVPAAQVHEARVIIGLKNEAIKKSGDAAAAAKKVETRMKGVAMDALLSSISSLMSRSKAEVEHFIAVCKSNPLAFRDFMQHMEDSGGWSLPWLPSNMEARDAASNDEEVKWVCTMRGSMLRITQKAMQIMGRYETDQRVRQALLKLGPDSRVFEALELLLQGQPEYEVYPAIGEDSRPFTIDEEYESGLDKDLESVVVGVKGIERRKPTDPPWWVAVGPARQVHPPMGTTLEPGIRAPLTS